MNELEEKVLRFIDDSPSKVTFRRIKNSFCDSTAIQVNDLKIAIANLISSGMLGYTFHFGRSFIERSIEKPLRVSKHVILKPARCSVDLIENCAVVSLEKGASFGCGDHPTTRLAIQLIDDCLHRHPWQLTKNKLKAIDIGTGSGILSITAAKLGIGVVIGIDIDPCSVYEAQENVNINHLTDRVSIHGKSINQFDETFDLVLANLRTPTLIELCAGLDKKLSEKAVLVLSGMKAEENAIVCESYQKIGFIAEKMRTEKGWSAVCLSRG